MQKKKKLLKYFYTLKCSLNIILINVIFNYFLYKLVIIYCETEEMLQIP